MSARLVGLVLGLTGVGLRIWGARTLQRAGFHGNSWEFITFPPGGYTEEGPYRYGRHPMYLGSLLLCAGVGMLALGWGGCVLAVAVVPTLRDRQVREDLLRETYAAGRGLGSG